MCRSTKHAAQIWGECTETLRTFVAFCLLQRSFLLRLTEVLTSVFGEGQIQLYREIVCITVQGNSLGLLSKCIKWQGERNIFFQFHMIIN